MRTGLWLFAGAFVGMAVMLARSDPQGFLRRLRAVKRRDRPIPNSIFFAIVSALVVAEAWAWRRAGAGWPQAAPFLVLSGYVPLTFLFYCNLIGVGNQRELSWMAALLGLCAASWALFGELRLAFILPPAILLTAYFCRAALRDPYCRYRVGLHRLDQRGDPRGAEAALRRALELSQQEPRYAYHLGRALKAQGREPEGAASMRQALASRPGLLEELRSDPLFKPEWL